nr:unnamed protein product [Digitaria exilis]
MLGRSANFVAADDFGFHTGATHPPRPDSFLQAAARASRTRCGPVARSRQGSATRIHGGGSTEGPHPMRAARFHAIAAFLPAKEGFLALISRLWEAQQDIATAGTCCLVVVVHNRMLFVANLGDSRARCVWHDILQACS